MLHEHDFLNINTLDKSIIIDMRYSYDDNFIGTKISGYNKNIAYLKKDAANQIIYVQKELKNKNMSLIIFDAYRPQKASEQFFLWCQDPKDQKMKEKYYPKTDKKHFFELGYLLKNSSHTRGIAVDLSIYDFDNNSLLDMGGEFDFFDEISETLSKKISESQRKNRLFLKEIMENNGFKNLPNEWWHYSLNNSDNYNDFYNFDVE